MKTMTIRCIDEPLAHSLKELAREQGVSLNTLALRLSRQDINRRLKHPS